MNPETRIQKLHDNAGSLRFLISNFCFWALTFSQSRRRKG